MKAEQRTLRHHWTYPGVVDGDRIRRCDVCGAKERFDAMLGAKGEWVVVTKSKAPARCDDVFCLPDADGLDRWLAKNCYACRRFTNQRGTTRYTACDLAITILNTRVECRTLPRWAAYRIGLRGRFYTGRQLRARCKEFSRSEESRAG